MVWSPNFGPFGNKGNTRAICKICSKHDSSMYKVNHRHLNNVNSGNFFANFEQISPFVVCFYCWLWTGKYRPGHCHQEKYTNKLHVLFLISSCFYLRVCNLSFYQKKLTSSRPEVFCKKNALENFTKFTGKRLCQSFFFNKVAGLGPLRHRCFPVNFVKFLTTPISIKYLWWLLLEVEDKDLTFWVTFLRH